MIHGVRRRLLFTLIRIHSACRIFSAIYLLGGIVLLSNTAFSETIERADDAFSSRDWEQAAQLYEEALPDIEGEDYFRALYRQADALRRAGLLADAVPVFSKVLEADEVDGRMRHNAGRRLADSLREKGEFESAVDAIRRTLEVKDVRGTVYADAARLGGDILALDLGRYDEAIEIYEIAKDTQSYVGVGAGWARRSDAMGRISYAKALRDDPTALWMGPYTTHVHDTEARVYWVSGEDDPSGVLGLSGGQGAGEYDPSSQPFRHVDGWVLHEVHLTGLDQGTEYNYVVRCGDVESDGRFRTAPAPDSDQRITFAVYGDTQDRPEFHIEMAEVIAESDPDFVLHTGDMVGSGDYWPHWKAQYFDPAETMLRTAPVWPSVGNHDGRRFYDPMFTADKGLYYSFEYGNVEVFIVASYRNPGQEQLEWVREALEASEADWTFVVTHYPMLGHQTTHWHNWGQEDYHPVFEEHDLDFVLTGHDHSYRRFLPVGAEGENPIFHITSGGGASVLGDYGHDGEGPLRPPTPVTPVYVRALHYVHFEIEGEELVMEARLRDGTLLDRLELTKSEGRYPDDLIANSLTLDETLSMARAYIELQDGTGRREPRRAPASFDAADDQDRLYVVEFENTFSEEAGDMRIRPASDSPWSFDPVVFAGGEVIRFEAEAPVELDSPGDAPLDVKLKLIYEEYDLVEEKFRVVPTN